MDENNKVIRAAVEAVSATLENMVFEQPQLLEVSWAEPPPSSQPMENTSDLDLVWAAIPLLAPYTGKMSIELAENFARDLAQNLYCGENCDIHEIYLDVLAEILNTLAGRFMIALLGAASHFELGFPSSGKAGSDEPAHSVGEKPISTTRGGADIPRSILLWFDISGQIFQLKIAGEDFVAMNAEMPTTTETTT